MVTRIFLTGYEKILYMLLPKNKQVYYEINNYFYGMK